MSRPGVFDQVPKALIRRIGAKVKGTTAGTMKNVTKDTDNVEDINGEVEDNTVKDAEVPKKVTPMHRPPPPFPQRLLKKTENGKYRHFITMLKQQSINVPLVEALELILGYAMFMKDRVTKKRSITFENDDRMQHCSAISKRSFVQKKEDQDALTIPCTIGLLHFAKALCDLGACINLMPLSFYKKLGLDDPKPTAMRILMVDQTVKRRIGILHDVLVKVESFIFPVDFVILDFEVDFKVTIILGRSMRQSGELQSVCAISFNIGETSQTQIEEHLGVEALAAVIMNFDSDCIEEYE
ncbi:uncharacterized protein [Solanum lycopersicum]|uniref:uncharacterized protein n=1 Tax=Solanum lycopersicum TaxID=4081 RepID=UPI0037497D49